MGVRMFTRSSGIAVVDTWSNILLVLDKSIAVINGKRHSISNSGVAA